MFVEQNMQEFLDILSTDAPVPGGGGASAYTAAIGMCLGSMVANLTTGKKKYAEYQGEIEEILVKADAITKELVLCMDKDAEAFEPLSKAYGLPRTTEEEVAKRNEIMEHALVVASEAPLHLMSVVMESITLLDRLAVIGSRIAISDVGVGIQMAKAALNGASLNVFINTKMMKDRAVAEDMNGKAEAMLKKGNADADRIYQVVEAAIK